MTLQEKDLKNIGVQIRSRIWHGHWTQDRAQNSSIIKTQVCQQFRTQVCDRVGTQVRDRVMSPVWRKIRNKVNKP